MEDGRKTKQRARTAQAGAEVLAGAVAQEVPEVEITEGADTLPAVESEAKAAESAEQPAEPTAPVNDAPAAVAPAEPENWPSVLRITNNSRMTVVEPITGTLIGPACVRSVTVHSPSHARQVIANIKAIARRNNVSASEIEFAGVQGVTQ